MSAVVNIVALLFLVEGNKVTPRQQTSPALTRTSDTEFEPNVNVDCDGKHYCENGACCPDFKGGFMCAYDLWANCDIYDDYYCKGDTPIICDNACCGPDDVCRDGVCYNRSSTPTGDHAHNLANAAGHLNMLLAQGTPPLGWFPDISRWNDGMLQTAFVGLHNMFLAVQANSWRMAGPSHPGQCFVIGFPSDLGQCKEPWDDGCKDSAVTIIKDGNMTLYNTDPIINLVGQEGIDWCNDDFHESQSQTYKYTYKESQTVSFTMSTTTKITVGMESKTKVEESLLVETASEELDFSFSAEVDMSSSSTQTSTVERDWEEDLQVNVGPRSHVYTECALSQGTIDSPYDLKVKLHTPIVWACSSPEDSANTYIYPSDPAYWQSFNIEQNMENDFGFTKADLEAIFSAKTGGTFKAVMGQKVVCNTHTVPLKDGESCKPPASTKNIAPMVV